MFLVAIIDLFTRKVVEYSMGESPNSELVIKAIKNAINIQKPTRGVILHSDRGIQFTSEETMNICKTYKIQQSFSTTGCPYDNAPMESFFATLKKEEVRQHKYKTIQDAKLAIFEYIEIFLLASLWDTIFIENILL